LLAGIPLTAGFIGKFTSFPQAPAGPLDARHHPRNQQHTGLFYI
jgi:hypothetical protein